VCCQDDNVARLAILGWFAAFSEHTKFWVFHVIRVVGHTNFAALPLETGIPTPCSNCTFGEPSEVDTFQFNHLFREWPDDDSRNFLIRAGGDQNCFYNWLQVRSRIGRND